MIKLLKQNQLYTKCDTSIFNFKTTKELKIFDNFLGQNRAVESINTALDIKYDGYNIYVMGELGVGKHSIVEKLLEKKAQEKSTKLYDWCYVNNFKDETKPRVIKLDAGIGVIFKKDMQLLIDEFKEKIPKIFKQKEFLSLKKELEIQMRTKQDELFNKLKNKARKENIFINDTTEGVTITPLKDGKVYTPKEYQDLNISQKEKIEKKSLEYKSLVDENAKLEMEFSNDFLRKIKNVEELFIKDNVKKILNPLKEKYKENKSILEYFDELEKDVLEHYKDFMKDENVMQENPLEAILNQGFETIVNFDIYNVNLIVNNENQKTAPVIYEDNPTYANLFGRIEHVTHMGMLTTDFNFIKAGALHRANGGYLVIDVNSLLFQPYSWEGLKRMLKSKKIHLESLEESMGLTSSVTLNPQSIEFETKIVLIGSRVMYYYLYNYDDDFRSLFKIEADFEDEILRDEKTVLSYTNIIVNILNKYKLLPLTRKALGRVIEFSSRLAQNSKNLSMDFSSIIDLLEESNLIALKRESKTIKNDDILKAILQREKRTQRIKEEVFKEIKDETILIDTKGEKVGQINALTVLDYGNFRFSMPVKISALTRVGKEGVIDIEREVDLSGAIHSKGVMILSSYLASRYSHDFSMSLTASLVFEQSYSIIDGDSASLAELYTILSSIAQIPIKQNIAITGSINQNGEVQAIGGVNEKIEGFFEVCRLKDEDFNAAVIIPYSNIKNLMLKEEVLKYVKKGQFKVYAIKHIDEGVELLMDIKAGVKNKNGEFTKGSLNYLVEQKLKEFSKLTHNLK